MCPLLLLFLLLAVLKSATPTENSTGMNFVIAFPESIAFYHPNLATNLVKITPLHDNTEVTILKYDSLIQTRTLNAGVTWEYAPSAGMELRRRNVSDRILRIDSNNLITVHVIYLKNSSVQTALVTPIEKMGNEYFIPPVPKIKGTTVPADDVTTAVTERRPFNVIVINAGQENKVTIEGAEPSEFSLLPHRLALIKVKDETVSQTVKAEHPVEVLFGHTCAIRENCTCGQMYAKLSPTKGEELTFYIPPVLSKNAEGETFVLLSEKDSTKITPFDPTSPLVKTAGTAVLYRPGLLLTLIPETDFASCSMVSTLSEAKNYAVILVHKDLTEGVHIGNLPLENPEWQELKGTEYVSTLVLLSLQKNVIWHSSSKMGVYFVGTKRGALFGNPAPIISKSPDFRGCAVTPEVVKIGEVAGSWRKSLKYCRDNNMELVSFLNAQNQRQIYNKLVQANSDNLQEVWIGMRRSSLTGEWYWLNKEPANDTNWAKDEPGLVEEGQCAMMTLESDKGFGWRDEDCCKHAHPLCYSNPIFLPM